MKKTKKQAVEKKINPKEKLQEEKNEREEEKK